MKEITDKRGYYVQQIDKALQGHDSEAEHLMIKFFCSKNNSNTIKAPLELVRIIRGWYELNGQDL